MIGGYYQSVLKAGAVPVTGMPGARFNGGHMLDFGANIPATPTIYAFTARINALQTNRSILEVGDRLTGDGKGWLIWLPGGNDPRLNVAAGHFNTLETTVPIGSYVRFAAVATHGAEPFTHLHAGGTTSVPSNLNLLKDHTLSSKVILGARRSSGGSINAGIQANIFAFEVAPYSVANWNNAIAGNRMKNHYIDAPLNEGSGAPINRVNGQPATVTGTVSALWQDYN
jgi:hypothetical protein